LKRLAAAKKLAKILDFKMFKEKYQPAQHLRKTQNLAKPARCHACYKLRLDKTAQKAAELGIKYFTLTLLVSPYQDLVKIKQIGQVVAKKYDLNFIDFDFVKDFRAGRTKARQLSLYCQKYCGCLKSLKEK